MLMPHSARSESSSVSNRLIREKSPYLLQHAHNPVDWYPWGEEAFTKARSEDKPIFLSIGYSTCHWCHVMEKESFEDPGTAELMNRHFVSIKVDREERPDLDGVYMRYVMATTGSGGWPMTVFLTPDKKPFYGGTYFPPQDRSGAPGFKNLLAGIAEAWKTRHKEILESADSAVNYLQRDMSGTAPGSPLAPDIFSQYFLSCASSFDPLWGGFGQAPKFPRSHALSLLLRLAHRGGDDRALEMAEKTLQAMAKGGMHDQLGGGFHRYSTDGQWRIPHFEKMLYDQALLSVTYLEAYQATHKPFYAAIARETLDYVLERLTEPEGGFYSAEDADSSDVSEPSQKKEGAYYVWTAKEIRTLLGDPAAKIFFYRTGCQDGGNALQDPYGELKEKNTLYEAHTLEETAEHFHVSPLEVRRILEEARQKLLTVRNARPHPHRDDKVLSDWNGLMIKAFALASSVLEEDRYRQAAVRAGAFISTTMTSKEGRLWHRFRDGDVAIAGHLDDYAFMTEAYLSLYETTLDPIWLERAVQTTDTMLDLFYDEAHGGFFFTAKDSERLIARTKEIYDGAVPSGNSVATLALLKLERATGNERYRRAADATLNFFAAEITASSVQFPQMLMALEFAFGPSSEIFLAGDPKDPTLRSMLKEIHLRFLPDKIIMLRRPGAPLGRLSAAYETMGPVNGKAAVYVCRGRACQLPVTDPESLKKLLEAEI